MKKITLYDTTLRDGSQTVGISFSLQDKLSIAKMLDNLKIDYIEGGWPGSNPKDDLFFQEIRNQNLSHSKIAAFGFTKKHNVKPEDDKFLQALVKSKADVITIVAKTWDFHVTKALNLELEDNLAMIFDSVIYLKKKGFEVFLDAEHFFDGYKANPEYAILCAQKAAEAGADMFVLCDTNGGTLPHEITEIISRLKEKVSIPLGIHCHNDSGLAVANSMEAVRSGAISVQGTINGYGERCGNCDLMSILPNLTLKMGYNCTAEESIHLMTEASRFVAETANVIHNEKAPYVGSDAFAHKGGLHVSAIQRDSRTYEHIDPTLIGNRREVFVSELSGKSNVEFKAEQLGIDLKKDVTLAKKVLQKIKDLEDKGYQFEAADGSFELIVRETTGDYVPFFNLKGFRVITEMSENGDMLCEATIKVAVDGSEEHTAADGHGPVEALDRALRKALERFYPEISELRLVDYKVRVLNEKDGTSSMVRVLIDQACKTEHWGTVGVSTNIIEASWQALVDGVEYMLYKEKNRKK